MNIYCTKVVLPCAEKKKENLLYRNVLFLYARRKGFLEATEKGNYAEMDFWSFYRNVSPDKVTRKGSPEMTLQIRIYYLRVF